MTVRTYGRWREVFGGIMGDPPALDALRRMVETDVIEWCHANYLRPVEEPTSLVADQMGPGLKGRVAILAEVRAAGCPPEQRLPRGRWAWLRMP